MRRPSRVAVLIGSLAVLALWIAIDSKTRTEPADLRTVASNGNARETVTSTASTSAAIQPEIPARAVLRRISTDPFSPQSWLPPPSKAVSVSPAAPSAPPLPFRFAGQLHQESGIEVFLARGEEIFPAKQGDNVDGQYRVESVTDSEITLVHLSSGTRQTLQFGPPLKETGDIARAGASQVAQTPAPVPNISNFPLAPTTKAAASGVGAPTDEQQQGKSAGQIAQLRWEGPQSAKAGANFSVALRVTSGEQIRSAPMQLRFDPALLESVSVRPGRYFGANADGNFGYRVNPDGSIYVGVSNRISAPASDAELLVLTFKPIRPGAAAEISVASLNLQGAAGRAIAYHSLMPFKTSIAP